ncbi:MAG TPA: DUF2637 domain-containing protein [Micromonosporaceae bacterium]|nr:DUF2637 domain-containing protein [Micromonosporaceae bacterium]
MTTTKPRDGWVMAGMAIAATSAAVASFTGLRGLALVAGWPDRLAWLLPVTIDAYAMTSARVWLAGTSHTRKGRRFAQANAIGAIATSIIGNAAYHAISVDLLRVSWPIVVVVGAVPAAVLGLTAHLHALRTLGHDLPENPPDRQRTRDGHKSRPQAPSGDGTGDRTDPRTGGRSGAQARSQARRRVKSRTEDELMAAARAADEKYRAAHGRPITRDELRTVLRIAGPRATELRRRLTTEPTSAPDPPAQSEASNTTGQPETPERTEVPDRKEANTTA